MPRLSRRPCALAASLLFYGAALASAEDSSGLPSVESILHPLPGMTTPAPDATGHPVSRDYPTPRAEMLVIGGSREDADAHPNIRLVSLAFKAHGLPVSYWQSGASAQPAVQAGSVVLAGDASEADQALRAVIEAALHDPDADPSRPVSVFLPLDGLYKDGRMGETLKDFLPHPRVFYETLIRAWINADPQLASGRGLRLAMADWNEQVLYDVAAAPGKKYVVVKLVMTEMRHVVGYSKRTFAARASGKPDPHASEGAGGGKDVAWPGSTPLLSGLPPALRIGRGDRGVEGVQGTVIKGGGLEPAYLNGSARLGHPGDGDLGALDLNVFQDASYGGRLRRLDATVMLTDNETMNHGVAFRYQSNDNPIERHWMVRGGYVNRVNLTLGGAELLNEAMLKFGYMKSEGLYMGTTTDFGAQMLYGAQNNLSLKKRLDWATLTGEAGGSVAYAQPEGESRQFDNAMFNGGLMASIPLPKDLNFDLDVTHRSIKYNTERYFFLDRRTDDQVIGALSWAREGLSAAILGGVSVTKGSQSDDVQKKAGLKLGLWDTAFTALANQGQIVKRYTLALSHTFYGKYEVEGFYNIQNRVDAAYREPGQIGLNIRVAFGPGGKKRGADLPDESRYRPDLARDDAYAERFYKDHGITLQALTGRMDSVRKANEWVGANVPWVTGSDNEWARYPDETYGGRGGDCDEQAWLISSMLNSNAKFRANGGQAYILDYWTNSGGHGVSLVKEGGRVYVSQYGQLYRVDVDANAPLDQIATAAMRQVSPYLALKPRTGENNVLYGVWGTQANDRSPGNLGYFTNQLTSDLTLNNFQPAANKPPVETGIATKFGDAGF